MNDSNPDYYDRYWDKGIDGWDPSVESLTPDEKEIVRIIACKGANILDVGCGNGRLAEYLRPFETNYSGVDISRSAVSQCKARGINAVECDFSRRIPLDDDTYDTVATFEVLEHLNFPAICMNEIRRILKPNGIVIGSVPNIAFAGNRLLLLLGMFNTGGSPATSLRRPWADPHIRFFTVTTLKRFIFECGFKSVKISGKRFMPADCPVLYRLPGITSVLNILFFPFRILGLIWPSLFAARIYFIARK